MADRTSDSHVLTAIELAPLALPLAKRLAYRHNVWGGGLHA